MERREPNRPRRDSRPRLSSRAKLDAFGPPVGGSLIKQAGHPERSAFLRGPRDLARTITKPPRGGALTRPPRSKIPAPAGQPHPPPPVFLAGLKNGSFTTCAVTFCRIASIVISICSFVPSFECAVSTLASAIIFFSTGDHVVVVALPTCLPSTYNGTGTRDAWLGAA